MRDTNARLAAILDAALCAIITIDEHGTIASVNSATLRMFGYKKAELIGRGVAMLMPSPHRERHGHYLARYLDTGEAKVIGIGREILAQRADGSTFPAHLSVAEVSSGRKRFFTGFVTDLSDLKRAERMQNEFVSMVNHELRTPLTAIKSSLGIIKTGALGSLGEEMRRMIEIASGNCDRLIHIINDLLDMEKIASGTLRFDFQSVELRGLLERFLPSNAALARDFGVTLSLSDVPEAFPVDIDPERIGQVLTNLVSNALKFSPPGETVRIGAARMGDWVRLSVEDRGPGIPASFQPRVFERFAQEDSSTIRKKGGTGLGLSISKAIVEAHGGRIGFDTDAGRGTVFFVDLPLAAAPGAAHAEDRRILAEDAEARA